MPAFDFLLHLLGFIAPAFFLALTLPLLARLFLGRDRQLLSFCKTFGLLLALGCLVLALGLVLTGQDGQMATYAVLVLVLASAQWLLAEGWRGD